LGDEKISQLSLAGVMDLHFLGIVPEKCAVMEESRANPIGTAT